MTEKRKVLRKWKPPIRKFSVFCGINEKKLRELVFNFPAHIE